MIIMRKDNEVSNYHVGLKVTFHNGIITWNWPSLCVGEPKKGFHKRVERAERAMNICIF